MNRQGRLRAPFSFALAAALTIVLGDRGRTDDELDETRAEEYDELEETREPPPAVGAG